MVSACYYLTSAHQYCVISQLFVVLICKSPLFKLNSPLITVLPPNLSLTLALTCHFFYLCHYL